MSRTAHPTSAVSRTPENPLITVSAWIPLSGDGPALGSARRATRAGVCRPLQSLGGVGSDSGPQFGRWIVNIAE